MVNFFLFELLIDHWSGHIAPLFVACEYDIKEILSLNETTNFQCQDGFLLKKIRNVDCECDIPALLFAYK